VPAVARVSVVTVCLNAAATIAATLDSVAAQDFGAIEQLVIDGGSRDGTVDIARACQPAILVSEPDGGIYPAMQKGALAATGDVVFFLNSGDTFHDAGVVSDVVRCFDQTGCEAVFGNLLPCYLQPGDSHDHGAFRAGKLLDLSYFSNRRLFYDESVHHQTMFYRRRIFDHCGFLCSDPRATGEYHLNMCAFVGHGLPVRHIARPICRFALGGASTADFRAEWERFATARDVLRGMYFPHGRAVPFGGEYEYLAGPPPLRTRMRIRLRRTPLHGVVSRAKQAGNRLLARHRAAPTRNGRTAS
jgi:glycosyltransferase involved in cell wall biosynthesis